LGPLITGVAVILLLSISPIRSVNGLLCLGVVMGGFVAGTLEAKANGNKLESTRGLLLGAKVGVVSALIVIAFDLVLSYVPLPNGQLAGVDYLDPIPKYIYVAIYGIYDGLLDLVARGEGDGLEWPGRFARYVILLASTFLFAGFGGGVASSSFVNQPSIAEEPVRNPVTPVPASYMRFGPAPAVVFQPAREAQIYVPPETARPAAATGTFGDPLPVQYAQPPPMQYSQPQPVQYSQPQPVQYAPPTQMQYSQPQPVQDAPSQPEQYSQPNVAPGAPQPTERTSGPLAPFPPQPYFDEAAQTANTERPRAQLSVEPPQVTPGEIVTQSGS
jgi:hypothetical protein